MKFNLNSLRVFLVFRFNGSHFASYKLCAFCLFKCSALIFHKGSSEQFHYKFNMQRDDAFLNLWIVINSLYTLVYTHSYKPGEFLKVEWMIVLWKNKKEVSYCDEIAQKGPYSFVSFTLCRTTIFSLLHTVLFVGRQSC